MSTVQAIDYKRLKTLILLLIRYLENVGNIYKAGVKESRLSKHLTPDKMTLICLFINVLQLEVGSGAGRKSLKASEFLTFFTFKSGNSLKEVFQKLLSKSFKISDLQYNLCLAQPLETVLAYPLL